MLFGAGRPRMARARLGVLFVTLKVNQARGL